MKLRIAIPLAGLACAVTAAPASADPNTKVDLFDESGTRVGFVNYSQAPSGDLRLVAAIKGADAGSSYAFSIACGADEDNEHVGDCPALELGTVATNGQGNGNSGAVHISVEALREVFGAGTSTVHIELGKQPGGGCLTAGGIALDVPSTFPLPEG